MSSRQQEERHRWVVAVVGALLAGAAFVAMFKAPVVIQRGEPANEVGQNRVGLTKVIRGEAALLDKTPLFLPTEWNTAHKEVILPQSGGAFANYAPKFAYDEAELRSLSPTALTAFSPADALGLTPPGSGLLGFGRSEMKANLLGKRGAFVEVTRAGGGQEVFAKMLVEAHPPSVAVWALLEFVGTVDAAGLRGPLVITSRSGVEEVDAYFQKYLTQKLRVGAMLGAGIYRIRVGP